MVEFDYYLQKWSPYSIGYFYDSITEVEISV